jgi:hypothetical protein
LLPDGNARIESNNTDPNESIMGPPPSGGG